MKSMVPFLIIIASILGLPLLLTRGPVARWVNDRVDRREPRRLQDPIYALLRREVSFYRICRFAWILRALKFRIGYKRMRSIIPNRSSNKRPHATDQREPRR